MTVIPGATCIFSFPIRLTNLPRYIILSLKIKTEERETLCFTETEYTTIPLKYRKC